MPRARRESNHRAFEFLTLSCVNNGLWSWLVYLVIANDWWRSHPVWAATVLFWVLFLSPVLLAVLTGKLHQKNAVAYALDWLGFDTVRNTPSAWQFQFSRRLPTLVLVTLKNGTRVSGLYGLNSFAGNQPGSHDLYVEEVCSLRESGRWEKSPGSAGAWIAGGEISVIEFHHLNIKRQDDHAYYTARPPVDAPSVPGSTTKGDAMDPRR